MRKLTKRKRKKIKELENAKRIELEKMAKKKARKEAELEKKRKEEEEKLVGIQKFCGSVDKILKLKLTELRREEEEKRIRRAAEVKTMLEHHRKDFKKILKKDPRVGNLIKFLIENNPEVNFGDFILENNTIYYSTKLNLLKIKTLKYPEKWTYCFCGNPTLIYHSDNKQYSYILSNI